MHKHFLFVLLLAILAVSCTQKDNTQREIRLADYIESDTMDIMPAIRQALDACSQYPSATLVLPEGHYTVKSDFAYQRYCYVSNNDPGMKNIAFDLTHFKHLEIKGNDTHLDFVGYTVPFLLADAEDISISGISIDYTTPFHSEGEITAVTPDYFDVHFNSDEFPYNIRNGCLYFDNKPTGCDSYNLLLEFDKEKREPAFHVPDYWVNSTERCEQLPNGDVRILREGISATVGNIMVFGCSHRLVPGFIISDSKDVNIHDVNVYHTGGMAFIAQRSQNIELNRVNVTPPPYRQRIVSATADATHFANCGGYIRLIDCVFENQKDDATNIHGIYAMISKIESPRTVILQYVHEAQHGFNFIRQGMNVEIVDNASLITQFLTQVESYEELNEEYTRVTFTDDLPEGIKTNFVVAQVDSYPEVFIKGCTIRSNRARGILLGSRAKMTIDSNYFHAAGAAILLEGDGSFWYEQSGVRDLEICHNTFENCNFGCQGWGNACIAVGTGLWNDRATSRYHHNISIHDNLFKGFDPRILNFYCTKGLRFIDNTIESTTDYPASNSEVSAFIYDDCEEVEIQRTTITPNPNTYP